MLHSTYAIYYVVLGVDASSHTVSPYALIRFVIICHRSYRNTSWFGNLRRLGKGPAWHVEVVPNWLIIGLRSNLGGGKIAHVDSVNAALARKVHFLINEVLFFLPSHHLAR